MKDRSTLRHLTISRAGLAGLALALWVVLGGPEPRPESALRSPSGIPLGSPSEERARVPYEPSNLRESSAPPVASEPPGAVARELLVTTLDQETLRPVEGARVEILPADASTRLIIGAAERFSPATAESASHGTTDAFGVARVALPAGLGPAHVSATKGAWTGSAWMDATRRRNVTIELSQRTELVVEVRDRGTGRAVSCPVVVARLAGRGSGEPVERLWASFVVAAFAPSPGHARVVIENSERLFADARGSGDRRVALLPAVLLMDGGVPVEQVLGREEPITLLAPAFGPVTIRVSDHDGSRFAGRVAVQVLRAFGPRSSWTTEVEVVDGAVRLERVAREGALEVHLRFPDRRDAEVVVARDEGPRAEDTELDVAIADPRTIRTILRGRLVDPAGEPLRSERLVVLETTKRGLVLRCRRPSLVTGDGGEREGGEAPDEPLVVDLRGVVFGHRVLVTDADATPVEGAAITVATEPGIVATTDADGFAALVCAGPVASVIVRAPGHEDRVASLTTGTNVVRLSSGVNVRLRIRPDLSHLLPEDWRPCLRLERVDPEPPPARTAWSPIEGTRSDCVVSRPGDYAVRLGRFADTDESKSGILALEEPSWTIRVGVGPVEDHELVVTLEQVRAFLAEPGIEGDG